MKGDGEPPKEIKRTSQKLRFSPPKKKKKMLFRTAVTSALELSLLFFLRSFILYLNANAKESGGKAATNQIENSDLLGVQLEREKTKTCKKRVLWVDLLFLFVSKIMGEPESGGVMGTR
jgi:hypothetical protein